MIKKQADLDFFEGTAPVAGTPVPSAGTPASSSVSHAPNADVLKMQTAMENFSNKVKGGNIPVNIPRELIQGVEKISGQPKFADGAWGPITQEALQNVANLGSSLTLLSERFGLTNLYTKENAAYFKENLSECVIEGNHITLSPEEQSNFASAATTDHINKISELYSHLLEKVQTTSNEGMLNANEKQIIQTGRVIVTHAGRPLEVPLSALTSLSNYSQFCTANNLNDKDKTEVLDLIINSSRTP
jgi:hypothetical protein